jgi:hypothetical protein
MLVEKARGVIILCSTRRSAAQTRKPTAHNPRQSFMSPLTWHGPFSFENVCYLVEVDPPHVRQWLQKWEVMIRAGHQYRRERVACTSRSPSLSGLSAASEATDGERCSNSAAKPDQAQPYTE